MRIATKEEWEREGYTINPDHTTFLLKDVEHISERWVTKLPNPKARDVDNTYSSEFESHRKRLIISLRKRAEIRRQIPTRKSVQEGKPDRMADLLEEVADMLEKYYENMPGR